ncbi:MFS transporter [Saccharothrix sp. BKS2]|uniref:MFS transporter n=1 Tax=Saccharothrix sp. BKS2 TaxID=3064400 RepID=UPI0039EB0D11
MTGERHGTAGYREVFALRAFRALFTAHVVSVVGDQLARVALVVLVYDRTGSAALSALAYALTFLPALVGGPLLAGLADRYPRRTVMITADLVRAAVVAAMAWPGLPWQAVCALLVVVQLAGAPAVPARSALLPALIPDSAVIRTGIAALSTVTQLGQVLGFAVGGVLVAALGPGGALLLDAATFGVSALLVAAFVPPVAVAGPHALGWWERVRAGAGVVWHDRRLLVLVGYAALSGTYIVGEALAAPYAAHLGGGPAVVGVLFAAYSAGCAAASLAVAALPESVQLRLMPLLAVGTGVPLLGCLADPPLPVVVGLFALSGAASGYHVVAQPTFVLRTPDAHRGQAVGFAITAMQTAQGIGITLGGLAAERTAPHLVTGAAGGVGVVAALVLAARWRAVQRRA